MMNKHDIVQVNENCPDAEWVGCLVYVTEVKSWGIQGFIKVPVSGNIYIRFKNEQIDYIGEAVMRVDGGE
jgi:hypothetical protein